MKYFARSEFACKCGCGFATVDVELLEVLEDLREFFGVPVTINSGCRCSKHNADVGGEPNSKHMQGIASDVTVKNTLPVKVYTYLDTKYPDKYGLGLYKGWVHIDVRPSKSRW